MTPTPSSLEPTAVPVNVAAAVLDALAGGATLGGLQGLKSTDYEVVYAVGYKLYAQARYRDAAVLFGQLVVRHHLEPRFLSAFAACLQMLGRHQDAAVFHGLASVLDPADPKPNFHVAECLIASGHPNEGAEMLDLVIQDCVEPQWEKLRERAQARRDVVIRLPAAARGDVS